MVAFFAHPSEEIMLGVPYQENRLLVAETERFHLVQKFHQCFVDVIGFNFTINIQNRTFSFYLFKVFFRVLFQNLRGVPCGC